MIFFDERFNFIEAADGGVVQEQVLTTVGSNGSSLTLANIKAPKNGYAYIYVSNQSNNDVYFDNLQAGIVQGNIAEENHYYAYGLKIAGLSSKKLGDSYEGKLKNNYLYNGKELLDEDADLGWLDYGFRNYDPQIGRFTQLDPLTFNYPYYTPYQFAGCEPIANIDVDGLEPENVLNVIKSFTEQGLSSISASLRMTGVNVGKWVVVGFGKNAEIISKVVNNTGKLFNNFQIAASALGIASKTLSITSKVLQQTTNGGDINSHFRIPDSRQVLFNNYSRAIDDINNDWHPIDPSTQLSLYHLPQGGRINYTTGQVRPNSTSIEMVDGPETWIPMILSGYGLAKLATGAVKNAAAKGLSSFFQGGRLANASELVGYAEQQGWKAIQSVGGPLKYVDEGGVIRMTIKQGSQRAVGSGFPHVELRNSLGKRIDAYGKEVKRKGLGNHTEINYDLQ